MQGNVMAKIDFRFRQHLLEFLRSPLYNLGAGKIQHAEVNQAFQVIAAGFGDSGIIKAKLLAVDPARKVCQPNIAGTTSSDAAFSLRAIASLSARPRVGKIRSPDH
jgi:hypothetical protein